MEKRNTIADRIPYIITVEEYLAEQRHSFFSNALLPLLEAGGHYPLQYKRTFISKQQDSSDILDRVFAKMQELLDKMSPEERREALLKGSSGSGRAFYAHKPYNTNITAKEVMNYGR